MKTHNAWINQNDGYWFRDFTELPETRALHARALPGYWQIAAYETNGFAGTMILANPSAGAPEIRIPLPATGRYAIAVGLLVNHCDRLLLKLERDRCFFHM